MNKVLFIISAMLLLGYSAFAQIASPANFGKTWIQGGVTKFKSVFNANGTVTNSKWDTTNLVEHILGHSCISDSFGNLMLTTNGGRILNKNGQIIQGGDTLMPKLPFIDIGAAMNLQQSTIILPMPDSQYYVPVTTYSDSQWYHLNNNLYDANNNINKQYVPADLLLYHKVDMRQSVNGGQGKVVKRMDTLIYDNTLVYTQMTAVRHGNGRDWWLVKQAHDTNLIYTFLFTPYSVYGPFTQGFSEPHFGLFHLRGQSVFNSDGNRYATTNFGANKIFTADFDRCSGLFSNPQVYHVPCTSQYVPSDSSITECDPGGIAFSPNAQFIYLNKYYSIQQLDLLDPDTNTRWYIAAWPDTSYNAFQGYLELQLAPNSKIYIGNYSGLGGAMSVINNPDTKGIGCNFCPKCLHFPPIFYQGVPYNMGVNSPPNMPHYELGTYFPCDTLQQGTHITGVANTPSPTVYPNPTGGIITFSRSGAAGGKEEIHILNMQGQMLQTIFIPQGRKEAIANLGNYPSGIYLYQYMQGENLIQSGKISKY